MALFEAVLSGCTLVRDNFWQRYLGNPPLPGDGASEVPEPATLGLLAGGLAFMGFLRRRASTRFAAR